MIKELTMCPAELSSTSSIVEPSDENSLSRLATGLSTSEVVGLRKLYGTNEVPRAPRMAAFQILIRQLMSSVIYLLAAAFAISALLHEYVQALGIGAAIVINAVLGFITEYKARNSLEALAKLTGSTVRVRRDGHELELSTTELVPGDIVVLGEGSRVPADLRILEDAKLSVDEAILTGESVPVWKTASAEVADESLLFQGTTIATGRAIAEVMAIGAETRLGKLGKAVASMSSESTPLEKQLEKLGGQLTILTIVICVVLAVAGMLLQRSPWLMLQTSIALAVAAIPEGLPVVATLALAIGVRRMVKLKALVRRLSAVETLGCTTVICTDKTGTLTENKMLVSELVMPQRNLQISGSGYEPVGQVLENGRLIDNDAQVRLLLEAATLCNDARVEYDDENGWHIHGDPTEGALLTAAAKVGINQEQLQKQFPRLSEVPFELSRKRMSTINAAGRGVQICCKGAPEVVFPLCDKVCLGHTISPFNRKQLSWFEAENRRLAGEGLRVLAIAVRDIEEVPLCIDAKIIEKELTLLGLVAISDRPRTDVPESIRQCKEAGIHLIMLTGDQAPTAEAIARELHIVNSNGETVICTGSEIESMQDGDLSARLETASAIARVTPEMKLKIVSALQHRGEVVAMTGDGVNDAPALKQSDIGVAMGKTGADLAKDVSDLVITDDKFSTIIDAIEQGRIIYDNIKRAIAYLLTASLSSVAVVSIGLLVHAGVLMTPLQLLWLNLIMHVFPSAGMVLQKGEATVMQKPPRDPKAHLLGTYEVLQILLRTFIVCSAVMTAILVAELLAEPFHPATLAFATLSLSLLAQSWSWVSAGKFPASAREYIELRVLNYPMLACTVIGAVFLLIALYVPGLKSVLGVGTFDSSDLIISLGAAAVAFLFSEILGMLPTSNKS